MRATGMEMIGGAVGTRPWYRCQRGSGHLYTVARVAGSYKAGR